MTGYCTFSGAGVTASPEADVDLRRAARVVQQANIRDATPAYWPLCGFGGLHAVGLKHDAVVAGDLADLAEQFSRWEFRWAEPKQVGVVRRAMRQIEPEVEQQRTFEQELPARL